MDFTKNIPTDLLRALVAVVDLKGFTRAGERLGRSQPAISLQIKRLQDLLGVDIFDREAGGGALTNHGQMVVAYARKILSLNDEVMTRLNGGDQRQRIRIGISETYAYHLLPILFEDDRKLGLSNSYDVTCDLSRNLIEAFDGHQYDLVIAFEADPMPGNVIKSWTDPLVWIGHGEALDRHGDPIPMATYPEGCAIRRILIEVLAKHSLPYDIVLNTPSLVSLKSALDARMAVSAISSRVCGGQIPELPATSGLPKLPNVRVGLFVRASGGRSDFSGLAERIVRLLRIDD